MLAPVCLPAEGSAGAVSETCQEALVFSYFRSAVAYYNSCSLPLERKTELTATSPCWLGAGETKDEDKFRARPRSCGHTATAQSEHSMQCNGSEHRDRNRERAWEGPSVGEEGGGRGTARSRS